MQYIKGGNQRERLLQVPRRRWLQEIGTERTILRYNKKEKRAPFDEDNRQRGFL